MNEGKKKMKIKTKSSAGTPPSTGDTVKSGAYYNDDGM